MHAPEVDELRRAIERSESLLIAAHINPDGDTIGAVLALLHGLRPSGRSIQAVCNDPVPANLRFLPAWEQIRLPEEVQQTRSVPDLAIMVDLAMSDRLGRARGLIERARLLAIIDHHQPSESTPAGIHILRPEASATCMVLYDIFPSLGIEITAEIAQCLLAGIATDTGNFRFPNTDPASLDAASHLVALGANIAQVNEEVWEKKPLPAVKLLGAALSHLELHADGRIAVSHLKLTDYADANACDEHTEGIVNEVGRVETALVAALFREPKPGRIRVSVRSRGTLDVSEVCRQFGGGGHVNAAGCTFEGTMNQAKAALLPALEACLESY